MPQRDDLNLTKCAVCTGQFSAGDYQSLAEHFHKLAEESDPGHVMWLNKNITKQKTDAEALSRLIRNYFNIKHTTLKQWMKRRFIERFYGSKPHPFVLALQHPSRATLLGYVIEHQHFLQQWVHSCAYIIAKSDQTDAILYELDNINTEFGGYGPQRPSHYELLIRMGESLGLDRGRILCTEPLPATRRALSIWSEIAQKEHWLETMAAMHSLELIANRNLKNEGASIGYFDPTILKTNEIDEAAKAFLKEGYEADVAHSDEALELIEKYAMDSGVRENVQATFLRSIDVFDSYLMARLERASMFESA